MIQEQLDRSEVEALFPEALVEIIPPMALLEDPGTVVRFERFYLTDNGRLKREYFNFSHFTVALEIWNVATKRWNRTALAHHGPKKETWNLR
jgi:hypothetical protein